MQIAFLITALVGARAVCNGQHTADVNCNSACQYSSLQASSGCSWTFQDPCYQCCWKTCLSFTIEGGVCGTDHGTETYEDCELGGSCLVGQCPIAPSSGGGGLSPGQITGISIGAIFGFGVLVVFLNCVHRCFCSGTSHAEQLTEIMPPAIK